MPAAKPEEFRRRAVELARSGDEPVAEIAKDLGTSESGLRRGRQGRPVSPNLAVPTPHWTLDGSCPSNW